MKAKTDLPSIKHLAQTFLMTDIETTSFSPVIVTHPFTSSGIVAFSGEHMPVNILEDKDARFRWQTEKKKQINESDCADRIFSLLTKPYRLVFLKYAEPYLSQKEFSQILSYVWIQTEAPHNDPNFRIKDLVNLFKRADPAFLMEQEDYVRFKALDDTLTVYCGVTSCNAKNLRGLSWTLNPETAAWFAHRFDEDGTVYEAQIY